jgi:hypothetical protein
VLAFSQNHEVAKLNVSQFLKSPRFAKKVGSRDLEARVQGGFICIAQKTYKIEFPNAQVLRLSTPKVPP